MEIEALRRQLSEEIAAQFEAKLREAKRQKSQIEEEFELSSEKWRTERRRLNAEIDRLESSLAEARQLGREFAEAGPELTVDPQEIARLQAAADEKIKEASQAWEKERARLQAEISRLQEGIAELIERSNNPLRSNPIERGKPDSRYDEALRAKRQAEDALVAAKAEWEAEKLTLAAETTKLRQSMAQAASVSRKGDEQLEKQLLDRLSKDAVRLQEQLATDLEKARLELSSRKEAHSAELQNITTRLQTAKAEWEAEKLNLVNESTMLRQAAAQATALANAPRKDDEQLEKRLQEAVRMRDGLAADLEKARQELARLKEAHTAELQNMTARLQAAKTEWDAEKTSLVSEAAKLRQSTATANIPRKGDDQLEKRLQEAIRTRDGLSADLEKSKHEIAKLKETHSAELQDFTGRYIKTRSDLERQLRESEESRGKLERDLEKAMQTSAQQDGALSEEVSQLKKQIENIQEEKKRLVIRLAETGDLVSPDVVNDLKQQFEARMQEIIQENSRLSEKVKNATSQLEGEAGRVKAADGSDQNGASLSTLDASAIDEEVKRVQELAAEIARLIDDPDTELATVIRKNVERAALDAYLKGILFSLGRGKKL